MTAADLAQSISRELPFLRRYARALTGSQTAGDNYAAATLEAILSDRSLMVGGETRIALFRTKPGLVLRPDFTLSDEEYNTYACPWHHNITTAIASFRTAKALRSNAGSRFDIHDFTWHNSTPFDWHSQQLMDLGLMEPGQWF